MKLTPRFVRVFQWIAPVVLTAFVLFGRPLFGAPLGWMALAGIFVAPLVIIGMYVPAIVFVFDRVAAAARRSRLWYDIASYTLWAALIILGLSIVDGGDGNDYGSVLSTWGVPYLVTDALFVAFLIISGIAWVATLAAAIVVVVLSRRQRP